MPHITRRTRYRAVLIAIIHGFDIRLWALKPCPAFF